LIIAAIDIGSNAARLLICEAKKYKDGTVDYTKLTFLRIPLRLGFDVFSTGRISDEKTKYLIESMAAYKLLMDIYKVEVYRACATSAMRDAKNGTSIIKSVKAKTGLNIEVIHGDEEANILYQSHLAEQLSANKAYLYVDVGFTTRKK
jgi:exopolyphosphatase/guanosine-5'-triphosphate,3'-diphosphate pyrophosphatase